MAVHRDAHMILGNFGGYGSGKTITSRKELQKHIFLTNCGTGIIGANVTSQYEQTIKRDFEADFPKAFYRYYSAQKNYADFINDYRLMYRPFDDPNKLRSYNVDFALILEASEVVEEAYTQLKTRLRNAAASLPETDENGEILYIESNSGRMVPKIKADWRRLLIESNPSAGWIKTSILNCANSIQKHGNIHDTYAVLESEADPEIGAHVTATDANDYLPDNFFETQAKNKPKWWIERYLHGSFLYADGLVYPSAAKWIVPTRDVPRRWKRICAFDYGLADASCYLFAAVDEMENILYFYKEVYVNNRSLEELAKLFFEASSDIPAGGWICAPIIDPKSGPKRDYDKRTLSDGFLDYGIAFQPGAVNREARVFRLNTYLESGRVRIFDCCTNFIRQLRELKFKQDNKMTTSPWRNEPEDKDDHAVVCGEWIVMELPKDPKNLIFGVYNKQGTRLDVDPQEDRKQLEKDWLAFALQDEPDYSNTNFYDVEANYTYAGGVTNGKI
jgi:hypothetical protein